ncbi:MarR family transcriptional regulator [Dehalococcoides mccartyi]|uniref:MarR family transcriptional regulator n=5 Tax=Dehalococcoidaceae TaxID=1202464 RepID=A0A2J1DX47_9CHLR|nr:MarR family transcriptional regulator [Dehalococcoides mccartyi]
MAHDTEYTLEQMSILNMLRNLGKADVDTMARLIIKEPNTLLQIMNRMVEKGYLEKQKIGRKTVYQITEEHRAKHNPELFNDYTQDIFDCFTQEEKDKYLELSDKLFNSVNTKLNNYFVEYE